MGERRAQHTHHTTAAAVNVISALCGACYFDLLSKLARAGEKKYHNTWERKKIHKGQCLIKSVFRSDNTCAHLARKSSQQGPVHKYRIFVFCVSQKRVKTNKELHSNKSGQIRLHHTKANYQFITHK
jgi:hypothetical protein